MLALSSTRYRSNSENILSGCLTKDANSKQNDSCAECFDANFEQREKCARCFPQALPSKQNDSCAECFDANFQQKESCTRSFSQALAFKQYGPILRKTTVAQSVLTPVLSNSKNAHGVFPKLYLRNNTGQFEVKRHLRSVILGQFRAEARLRTLVFTSFIENSKSKFLRYYWPFTPT